MNYIKQDFLPRKYHLRWDSTRRAIIIQIHKDCVRDLKPLPHESPWLMSMQNAHRDGNDLFKEFSSSLLSGSFGASKNIVRIGEVGDYIEFAADFPVIQNETGQKCPCCEGTKIDLELERDCYPCNKTGKEFRHEYDKAFALTASLSLLFLMLELHEFESDSPDEQDVLVQGIASERGQHGSSLGGCFGIAFTSYIALDPPELDEIMKNVHRDIKTAWGHMYQFHESDEFRIRINSGDGYLAIDVPGDATGIHFSSHDNRGRGAEFTCHNVDTPGQCLALLAGIASLVGQVKIPEKYRK